MTPIQSDQHDWHVANCAWIYLSWLGCQFACWMAWYSSSFSMSCSFMGIVSLYPSTLWLCVCVFLRTQRWTFCDSIAWKKTCCSKSFRYRVLILKHVRPMLSAVLNIFQHFLITASFWLQADLFGVDRSIWHWFKVGELEMSKERQWWWCLRSSGWALETLTWTGFISLQTAPSHPGVLTWQEAISSERFGRRGVNWSLDQLDLDDLDSLKLDNILLLGLPGGVEPRVRHPNSGSDLGFWCVYRSLCINHEMFACHTVFLNMNWM